MKRRLMILLAMSIFITSISPSAMASAEEFTDEAELFTDENEGLFTDAVLEEEPESAGSPAVEAEERMVINAGEAFRADIDGTEKACRYAFTPTESGEYLLEVTNTCDFSSDHDFFIDEYTRTYVYTDSESVYFNAQDTYHKSTYHHIQLTAGITYYFDMVGYTEDTNYSFDCVISKKKEIANITCSRMPKVGEIVSDLILDQTAENLNGMVVRLNYADGTSKDVAYNSQEWYREGLSAEYINSGEAGVYINRANAEKQLLCAVDNTQSMATVFAANGAVEMPADGTVSFKNIIKGDRKYITFTSSQDCLIKFHTSSPVDGAYMIFDEEKCLARNSQECVMKAGKTYYMVYDFKEDIENVTISQNPQSVYGENLVTEGSYQTTFSEVKQEKIFAFVPAQDGDYILKGCSGTPSQITVGFANPEENPGFLNDDEYWSSVTNESGIIGHDMKAGCTYYLKIRFSDKQDTGTINWSIQKKKELTNVECTQKGAGGDTYYKNRDYDWRGAKFRFTYADGTSEELPYKSVLFEMHDLTIRLEEGEFRVYFYDTWNGEYSLVSSLFSVTEVDSDEYKNDMISFKDGSCLMENMQQFEFYEVLFQANKTGSFDFEFEGSDAFKEAVWSANIVDSETGDSAYWTPGEYAKLEEGKDYFITFSYYGSPHDSMEDVMIRAIYTEDPCEHEFETIKNQKATCELDATKTDECTKCGKTTYTWIDSAKGHKFSSWKTVKKATALEEGEQERICLNGGEKETKTLAKLKATGKLNMTTIKLQKGQNTTKLKVSGLAYGDKVKAYSSSNKKIFTVNSSGKIYAKSKGIAKLTVTLASGKKLTATVKVYNGSIKTTDISVNMKSVTLKKRKSCQLKTTVSPLTSQEKVTYKSSKTSVATVSSSGKIVAKKKGTAYITVKSGTKSTKVKVVVK